jgi:hypothetical protein
MHVAYFRGVSNAPQIRDLLREGVRRQRGTGLGDPDEQHDDEIEAARILLDEVRALREPLIRSFAASSPRTRGEGPPA